MTYVHRPIASVVLLLLCCLTTGAQEFFNLTAQQVRIDSLLPCFTWQKHLGPHYADSVYTVSLQYPEFIDMSDADVVRYQELSGGQPLPALPVVEQHIGVSRKQGMLDLSLLPLVCRDGRYQKLVSFQLKVEAQAKSSASKRKNAPTRSSDSRYAAHSVLASGTWAKIYVTESGIYQLSPAFLRKCGFSDATRVKIYGYGGALQPESLTGDYLTATDDLKEVPTCTVGEQRLFYAVGPVTWDSAEATQRTRNTYADYGCYFLTESDEAPLTIDETQFLASCYPRPEHYHSLYEVDDYAWFHGGRNLADQTLLAAGTPQKYSITASGSKGTLSVVLTYDANISATIAVNDSVVKEVTTYASFDSYTKAAEQTYTCYIDNLNVGNNTVSITKNSGGNLRLDYLSLACTTPQAAPDLTATQWPTPQYLYNISNQDHHADEACDMVIIIPTSQSWRSQAERLKTLHEERDGLSVRIVPADELYNEFSSGTPDASAYKRYMKMLYDRAASDAQLPRYLLLFGDGAWDNRMRSSAWSGYSPDDFLLCYESDNSFSEIYCYVSDDFFCLLDDEEEIQQGSNYLGKPDVAVGRLSARTLEEATILVDKIESYTSNEAAGSWQNTLCFMGDDGNNNAHMLTADKVATMAETNYPGYTINKIYWDAYERVASSTGHSFPAVTQLIKEQMQKGALLMNYSGHGAAYAFSHELVVQLADFAETTSMRLPLWVTASCDIMPFDGQEDNIGETAMLNRQGGSIAFFGTTRTVYANYNEMINLMFTEYVLGSIDGKRTSIGEAARLAKCDLVSSGRDTSPNKLQYTLLGDPALVLATPTQQVVIDSINGVAVANSTQRLAAGSIARMAGHVVTADASYTDAAATAVDSNFRGTVTATVRDAEETITCRLNNTDSDGAETPFVYKDRTKTIYQGSDSIRNGRFALTFAVPKDISYTDGKGLLTLYALDNEKTREAHGQDDSFVLNGTAIAGNDSIGPSIYCYLNTPSFVNGGQTNTSPYFVAELYDANGINASGSSVGHDLELIIDGKMATTYNLNAYFTYDFGDYRRGSVGYSIPALDYGWHSLLFRAWDVLNNSSTAALDFEVAKGLAPNCVSVSATRNPTSGTTTFIITHDRAGCQLDVELDIFDTAGRQLYKRTESGTPTGDTYTLSWDLTTGSGQPLQTGVYLYRVSISSDGSSQSSMAKKLIIVKH